MPSSNPSPSPMTVPPVAPTNSDSQSQPCQCTLCQPCAHVPASLAVCGACAPTPHLTPSMSRTAEGNLLFSHNTCRLKTVSFVSKQLRGLCLAPELLCSIELAAVGTKAVPRCRSLHTFLSRHAAQHLRCLTLHVCIWETAEEEEGGGGGGSGCTWAGCSPAAGRACRPGAGMPPNGGCSGRARGACPLSCHPRQRQPARVALLAGRADAVAPAVAGAGRCGAAPSRQLLGPRSAAGGWLAGPGGAPAGPFRLPAPAAGPHPAASGRQRCRPHAGTAGVLVWGRAGRCLCLWAFPTFGHPSRTAADSPAA